jgi:hypothetical protein
MFFSKNVAIEPTVCPWHFDKKKDRLIFSFFSGQITKSLPSLSRRRHVICFLFDRNRTLVLAAHV